MQTSILKMEVRHKQKHVATFLRYANEEALVIGQSKKAQLRLVISEVSPVHAVVHNDWQTWCLRDLGSSSGTWVNKKAITEYELQPGNQIRIGQHDIYITTYERDPSLFATDKRGTERGITYHQIILKKKEKLYNTHLLKAEEKFVWKGKDFPAPSANEVLSQEIDGYTIEQRIVRSEVHLLKSNQKSDGLGRETLIATGSVGVLFLVFLVFSIFSFTKPGMDIKVPEAKTAAKFIPLKMEKSNFVPTAADAAPPAGESKAAAQGSAAKMIASSFSAVMGRVTSRLSKASINLQRSGAVGTTATNSSANMGIQGTSQEGVSGLAQKIGAARGAGTGVQVMGGNGVAGIGQVKQGTVGSGQVAASDEESEVMGGLDKEVIAKIIRSYLGQIRYCYERQLSATPDLYGKLLVQFSIGQAGTVNTQSILSSSLQNKNVEGCVLRQVAAWKFPQPKGGTIVKVSYPFLFTSTK